VFDGDIVGQRCETVPFNETLHESPPAGSR
jgi:hypothetical protein